MSMQLNFFTLLITLIALFSYSVNAEMSIVNFNQQTPEVNSRSSSFNIPKQSGLYCWDKAEIRYGVPAKLLVAIAKVETGINPSTVGKKNKDGSYDIGLMQINSGWLPKLSKYNITENDLFKPCTNIMVGAWILSDEIN